MGVDCCVTLPPYVRMRDVAKVAGISLGAKKHKQYLNDANKLGGWYVEVPSVRIIAYSDSLAECAGIEIRNCDFGCMYHFEFGQNGCRGIMLRSRKRALAVMRRLVDFFGGDVDYNDHDETDADYHKDWRPANEVCPTDDGPWQKFQERLWRLKPLTQKQIDAVAKYAAYVD